MSAQKDEAQQSLSSLRMTSASLSASTELPERGSNRRRCVQDNNNSSSRVIIGMDEEEEEVRNEISEPRNDNESRPLIVDENDAVPHKNRVRVGRWDESKYENIHFANGLDPDEQWNSVVRCKVYSSLVLFLVLLSGTVGLSWWVFLVILDGQLFPNQSNSTTDVLPGPASDAPFL